MRALGEVQPHSGEPPAIDSGDPLRMVLRESADQRRDNNDVNIVVPALPPPPQSAADQINPLELMLQQTTTAGMETRSNAVGLGAPSPSDEMLLYLNNATISPWNENMFSF